MGPTEFRIGNWFYNLKEHETQVYKIDEDSVNGIIHTGFCGIVLTEEWFLKFKFIKVEHIGGHSWAKDGVNIGILGFDNTEFCFNSHVCDGSAKYIKYVHQLQNLYFALKDKELKIK